MKRLIKQLNNIYIHAGAVESQIRRINDGWWWKEQLDIYGMERLYEIIKVAEQCGNFDWSHTYFMIDYESEQAKSFGDRDDILDWIGEGNLESMGVNL